MINVNNLCMGCMKEKGDALVCPYCGHGEDAVQKVPYLALKTWLMDRYLVGKVLHSDGEGVTYLGWDNITQSAVLIREFLPEGLCGRVPESGAVRPMATAAEDFSRAFTEFLNIHRLLSRMRDLPALFATYDVFEYNGTAYSISTYVESITLKDFLQRNGNSLTFEQTRALMMPAATTLSSLHGADVIHGGISPETLYVGKDGKLRFYGFGGRDLRSARGAIPAKLYAGYAAMEQYGLDGNLGTHTDVYAFAATMYRVITGIEPVDAKVRLNQEVELSAAELSGKMPQHAAETVIAGMALMPAERIATVEQFRSEFSAAPSVAETRFDLAGEEEDVHESQQPEKKNKTLPIVLIAMGATLTALLLIIALIWGIGKLGGGEPTSTPSLLVISEPSTPSVDQNSALIRKVPDFVGQSLESCQRNYASYEFRVEYKVYNDEFVKNMIISQSPAAGTELPLDATQVQPVTVVVSLGSGQLQIPDVVGKTYAQAIEELWKAGFSYDSFSCNTTVYNADSVVTKITPAPGTSCNIYEADIMLYLDASSGGDTQSNPSAPEENKEVSEIPAP